MSENMVDVPDIEEAADANESNILTLNEVKQEGIFSKELEMGLKSGAIVDDEKSNDETLENKTDDVETQSLIDLKNDSFKIEDQSSDQSGQSEYELNRIRNDIKEGRDLSEQDEYRVHKELSKDEKGFYFKAKKEKKQRQAVQQHNDLIQKTLEAKNKENEILSKKIILMRALMIKMKMILLLKKICN